MHIRHVLSMASEECFLAYDFEFQLILESCSLCSVALASAATVKCASVQAEENFDSSGTRRVVSRGVCEGLGLVSLEARS